MKNFNDFNLNDDVRKYIELNEFREPTAIQQKVIPLALKKKNIIGISKTGSGKSHAFLIPLLNMIDVEDSSLQVMISAPTRELAIQLYQKTKLMNKIDPRIKIVEAVGGSDRQRLIEQVKDNCQILIGTPGRIKDLVVTRQALRVDKVKLLVIDEADMTFEYGFLDDVDQVAAKMPKKLQIMVFGATVPQQLQPFIKKYISQPTIIDLGAAEEPGKIKYVLVDCKHHSYEEQLVTILPGIQPYVCLIFANTRKEAVSCAEFLEDHGYQILQLHGDLLARERRQALKQLQSHSYTYVVATDLAARGIDIETVTHIISLGFPQELDFFIHRAGRTGRMGKSGTCITLYQSKDEAAINTLKKRGIHFFYETYRNNQWRELKKKPRRRPLSETEKEIAKIVSKKNEKVKPGYKKKRQAEVERIKRKRKRELIQASINEIKKAKNKQRQKNKTTR